MDVRRLLATEPAAGSADAQREYFFAGAMNEWFDKLKDLTFDSAFVPVTAAEARQMIEYWRVAGSKLVAAADDPVVVPAALSGLVERVDAVIHSQFPAGAFVKLSTRSPKDSTTVFRKAARRFRERLTAGGGRIVEAIPTTEDNARLVAFQEEMVKAAVVTSGAEAVAILLDSARVAGDLMYALDEGPSAAPISIVVRAWSARVTPQCEFRAFVHERRVTAMAQYWHTLYVPELAAVRERVVADCLALFERIKDSLPVPSGMLDLAWLGPSEVVLIELNPLLQELRFSPPGLFDYFRDADVLTGKAPFQLRLREEPEGRAEMRSHLPLEWQAVVFGDAATA